MQMSVANSSLSNSIRNRNVVILQETGNLNMKVTWLSLMLCMALLTVVQGAAISK